MSKIKYPATKKVRLPIPLWGAIKDQSEKEDVPMWVIVERAFTAYISRYRGHWKKDADGVDKAAWYAFKIGATIGRLYDHDEGTLPEELQQTMAKVLAQVKERIGVDTSLLEAAIQNYLASPSQETRMLLSGEAKKVIAQIIDKCLSSEKE